MCPQEVLLTLQSCDADRQLIKLPLNRYWVACKQTILQEQHAKGKHINGLQDCTPDARPVTTLSINPGLRLAPEYTGYMP